MAKKKIIFLRASEIHREPRAEKEIALLLGDYDVEVLCWDRENKSSKIEKRNGYLIHRCRTKGKYGGGLKNVFFMLKWWIFEFFWLLKNPFDVLHACDFDAYLPALFVAKVKRKKIIYDLFDFYGDMVTVPELLKNIIKKIDIFLIQFADGTIVTDENRINQIKGAEPKRLTVIYNTPPDFYDRFYKNIERPKENYAFTLGYIGLLEKIRGYDMLIQMVAEIPNARLILGGISISETEEGIAKRLQGAPNVNFIGRVAPYEITLKILSECDAMFALYDPSTSTHKYSSANKVFESMMLEKPLIVSKNTGMDKIIEKYETGIVVEYNNKDQIRQAILRLIDLKKTKNNFYGKNGRNAYVNVFHYDIMKKRLLSLYADVFSKKTNIEDYAKTGTQYYSEEIPFILEKYLESKKYKSLLDCGCGDGGRLYALKRRGFLKDKDTYALDLSENRIKLIGNIDRNIKAFVDNAETISKVKDNSIDFLICEQVIEHVDQVKLLNSINRVTESGSIIYLSTVFKKWYGWYFYRNNNKWVLDPTHLREYKKDAELFDFVDRDKFEIVENRKELIFFPLMDSFFRILNIKNREVYGNKFLKLLGKIKRPVPGYYNWEIVLRKK